MVNGKCNLWTRGNASVVDGVSLMEYHEYRDMRKRVMDTRVDSTREVLNVTHGTSLTRLVLQSGSCIRMAQVTSLFCF